MIKGIALVMLACATWLAAPAAGAAEPRIGNFVKYDTGEFVIVTSRSGSQAREIIQKLVKFRLVLEKLLGKRAAKSGIGTHIIIVSGSDFDKYLSPRDKVAGFFHRSRFDNYMAMDGDAGDYAVYIMFHEYTHYYLSPQFAGEYPPWFNEGLAELMAYTKFAGNKAVLQIPMFRVHEARDSDWIPFERLIKVDYRSPEYQSHKLANAFYAQAWLTVHYGMLEDRAFGAQYFDYLAQMNLLVPQEQAARNTFGPDLSAIDSKLRAYSRNTKMASGTIDLGDVPEAALPAPQPMSDADAIAALVDLMISTRRAPDRTRTLVESLLRREPEAARSHILAARLAELENESAAFDAAVEKAGRLLTPDDRVGRRDLASALLANADDFSVANDRTSADTQRDLKRALKWFAEAVERDSADPKALWGLGTVLARLNVDLDLAETALEAAYERVPASSAIALSLANLKGVQNKPEERMRYLKDVIRIAGDMDLRRWAIEALEREQRELAEQKRVDEENRKQREAYEKELAEYEKKYGKVKKAAPKKGAPARVEKPQ
jgi:hypothetical protein